VTDQFGKAIPAQKGDRYYSVIVPRNPPKPRDLTPEERAERKKASERLSAAAAAYHVSLLDAGMKAWLERAKQKFLQAGGYGCRLTATEEAEIRAAGFEPKPPDR
jgi:hypothetical protein